MATNAKNLTELDNQLETAVKTVTGTFVYSETEDVGLGNAGANVNSAAKTGKTIEESLVDGNAKSRVLTVGKGYSVTLNKTTLTNGYDSVEGGLLYSEGSVTVIGGTFSVGKSGDAGGAITNGRFGTFTASEKTLFTGNVAENFGGAVDNRGDFTVTAGTFTANTSNLWGGAVYNETDAGFKAKAETYFSGNTAVNGGAVFNDISSQFTVDCATITKNVADYGAGVYNQGSVTIQGGAVINANVAAEDGGAIYNRWEVTAEKSIFDGNKAKNGAVVYNELEFNATSNTFSNNIASENGGVVYNLADATVTLNANTFSANTATAGGVLYLESGSTAAIQNNVFSKNTASADGGAIFNASTAATIEFNTFTENRATGNGGAIYSSVLLTTSTNTFNTNSALNGGAIYNDAGTYTSTGDKFTGNIATENGGAVYNSGTYTSTQDTFTANTATENGGAVYDVGENFTASTSSFNNNMAENGGAVYTSGTFTATSSTFSTNSATENGGAVYTSGTFTATSSTFVGNSAAQFGGAVAVLNASTFTADGSTFSGNSAGKNGGAVYSQDTFGATNSTFSENIATENGGAVYNTKSFAATGSMFGTNSAANGGAVYNDGGTFTATSNTFSGNVASADGGAVYNSQGTFTATNITFSENSATNGGAVYNTTKLFTATTSTFDGNSATKNGGAVYNDGGTFTATTSTFGTNSAANGGAVYVATNGAFTATSNTFSMNSATENGGAVYVASFGASTATSNTFSGNIATKNGGAISNAGTFTSNANTFGTNTAANGGAVYNTKKITVNGDTFTANTASSNGGAVYNTGVSSDFTATTSTFSKNVASVYGGAVYNDGNFTSSTNTFTENSAKSGGAVYNATGTFTATSNTFGTNSATADGGAIYNAATFASTANSFDHNTAANGGAVMNASTGIFTATNNTFSANSATANGGAIQNKGTFTSNTNTFTENSAASNGGAIYNAAGTFTATSNTFGTNTAVTDGGAIYNKAAFSATSNTFQANVAANGGAISNDTAGIFTAKDNLFSANSASYAGAIANSGTFTATGNTFSANKATTGNGGAISNGAAGTFTATSNTFSSNSALLNGGAISNESVFAATIDHNTFTGNIALNGGAIANSGKLNSSTNMFTSNTATNNGGAVANNGGVYEVKGDTYTTNIAAANGGAIYNDGASANFTATAAVFNTNTAVNGGAIYNTSVLTANTNTFTANSATTNGGAVYNSGTLTANAGTFSKNTAVNGGAVYNTSIFAANTNMFTANSATTDGGAIYNSNTLTSNGGTFSENTAVNGGAIANYGGKVSSTKDVFAENVATTNGGAIYSNGSLISNGGTFSKNVAANGGAIANYGGTVSSTKDTFEANTASANGGAIYNEGDAPRSTANGGTFSKNVAANGGAIYNTAILFESGTSNFKNNTASADGGAIYNTGTFSAKKNEFEGNKAVNGGAVYNTGNYVSESDNFLSNVVTGNGGAIYNTDTFNVSSGAINGNTAANGGAVYTSGNFQSEGNNTFASNVATENGGAAYVESGSFTVASEDVFSLNKAQNGGAVYSKGTLKVNGATFSENTASAGGGAIYSVANSAATVTDSYFNMNNAVDGAAIYSENNSISTVTGNTFFANAATGNGGAIHNLGKTTLTGNEFTSNNAAYAGAVYNGPTGVITAANNTFSLNNASQDGGAVSNSNKFTSNTNTFKENTAKNGGAIYNNYNASFIAVSNDFNSNTATADGGAVFNAGTVEISESRFRSNLATNGAAVSNSGDFIISLGTFSANTATGKGGAIYNSGTVSANTVAFRNNIAKDGGAIYSVDGPVTVESTEFRKNIASENGGAIYINAGTVTILGSEDEPTTFVNNAADKGGAVYVGAGATLDASNAIFRNNRSTSSEGKSNGGAIFGDSNSQIFLRDSAFLSLTDRVYSSGSMVFGGTVSTVANITAASYVFTDDSDFVFDITLFAAPNKEELLTNFANAIEEANAVYSVAVSENQRTGTYILASNASNFSDSRDINISIDGLILGTTTLDKVVSSGTRSYLVKLQDNKETGVKDLVITVGETIAPVIDNIRIIPTTWTNNKVTVTADFHDNDELASKEYSIDEGKTWKNYTVGVIVEDNFKTVMFRAKDVSGNETTASIQVKNIDKEDPIFTDVSGNPTTWTKGPVTITVTYEDADATETSGKSEVRHAEYSTDGFNWNAIPDAGIKVTENGDVLLRLTDWAGNIATKTVSVTMIDKYSPSITAFGNPETWTAGVASISLLVIDDVSGVNTITYTLNGTEYTYNPADVITVTENTTISVTATDYAGNYSTMDIVVSMLDNDAPTYEVTVKNADGTAYSEGTWTNQSVTFTAAQFDDGEGSGVNTKQYSTDGGKTWTDYTTAVTLDKSGNTSNIIFRVTDNVGNVADKSYTVNFDVTVPDLTVSGDLNTWRSSSEGVTLTPVALDLQSGVEKIEYSTDNKTWTTLTGVNYTAYGNGTVYFRATDKAGNTTDSKSVSVWNIDSTSPTFESATPNITGPTNTNVVVYANFSDYESGVSRIQFSIDDGATWSDCASGATITENCTVYFRAIDKAGNVSDGTSSYKVENIDKVAPVVSITADKTDPTAESVTLTVTITETGSGVNTKQYSIDGKEWTDIDSTNKIVVSKNSTVYVKVTDKAGNVTEQTVNVSNIDTIAPALFVSGDISTWKQSTTIFATATDEGGSGLATLQYKIDSGSWKDYPENGVVVTANGKITFKATDNAGNSTERVVEVGNIDTDVPVAGDITASTTEATNGNVIVHATYSDDASGIELIEYSLDGSAWTVYGSGVEMTENGDIYFRATDKAGNVTTAENKYSVTNIDKVNPDLTVAGDVTTWVNDKVELTVTATDNVALSKAEYSLDGVAWTALTLDASHQAKITVNKNSTVYVRATDTAGNVSAQSINVSNIDTVKPTLSVAGNTNTWTNQDIVLALTGFDAASGISGYKYSADDGKTWTDVTGNSYTVSANGTYSFKALDVAGNESDVVKVVIDKIDKDSPTNTGIVVSTTEATNENVIVTATYSDSDSGVAKVQYSFDGTNWSEYGSHVEVTKNGSIYFRAVDNAGNVSDATDETKIENIDKVVPTLVITGDVITWVNDKVELTVTATDNVALSKTEYSLDGTEWTALTLDASHQAKITVTDNGTVYVRTTDTAGNVTSQTVNVNNIDKIVPDIAVNGDISTWKQSTTIFASATDAGGSGLATLKYSIDNGANWTDYTDGVVMTANGDVIFKATDNAGNMTSRTVTVANIDTTAPVVTASASTTDFTNKDVKVSIAIVEEGSGVKLSEYSFDQQHWYTYVDGVTMKENGTVYFKSTDNAANVSQIVSYEVKNIDKEVPTITNITVAPTTWTDKVTVSANFADTGVSGLASASYSLDGETWTSLGTSAGTYTTGEITSNGMVYLKAVDKAGNETIQTVVISNIDKEAPVITVSGNPDTWTNQNVVLTVSYTDDVSGIATKQYSFDNSTWIDYTAPLNIGDNMTVYFKATDNTGKETTSSVDVTKIDKYPPTVDVSSDITTWTNQNVTVTAVYNKVPDYSEIVLKQYSYDQVTWTDYTDATKIVFDKNGNVFFRVTDGAGNVTVQEYKVENIDKVKPTSEGYSFSTQEWTNSIVTVTTSYNDLDVQSAAGKEGSGIYSIEYSTDGGSSWATYTSDGVKVAKNDTVVKFRATDHAGNVSEITTADKITWIDTLKPVITVTGNTPGFHIEPVVLTMKAEDAAAVTGVSGQSGIATQQYSLDGINWIDYTEAITITKDTYVYFRVTDKAGNVATHVEHVTDIDLEAPVITVYGNPETWTAGSVSLSVVVTEGGSGLDKITYSLDGGTNWITYHTTDIITILENDTTVIFKATDKAGNEATETITVSKLDNTAPTYEVTAKNADNTAYVAGTWTNQSVTFTAADFDDVGSGIDKKLYSTDGGNTWVEYATPVTLKKDESISEVIFRAVDKVGNATDKIYRVNFDITAPELTVNGDLTTWRTAETGVMLTPVAFDGQSGIKKVEYSTDGTTWTALTDEKLSYTATANGTVYFKATDNIGNTVTKSVVVANIDNTAPEFEGMTLSTDADTNGNVVVTATYSDDASGVAKVQYSFNGTDWSDYGSGVAFTQNGSIYFRAIDVAGNVSDATDEQKITNIDKLAPKLSVTTSESEWTKEAVTLTITVADQDATTAFAKSDIKIVEYRIDGTGDWISLGTSAGTYKIQNIAKNGTVYVRTIDKAGNVTSQTVNVTNIDTIAPAIAVNGNISTWAQSTTIFATATDEGGSGLASLQYKIDNGSWKDYADGVVMTANGKITFKAIDNAGNSTERIVEVNNIDTDVPVAGDITASTTVSTNGNVIVHATYSDSTSGVKKIQYSLDGSNWSDYGSGVEMTANGDVYFRAIDNADNVTTVENKYSVTNIDKVAPTITEITLSKTDWTNAAITIKATYADNGTGVNGFKEASYSFDGINWTSLGTAAGTFTTGNITKNGVVYLKAVDKAGNVTVETVTVDNIDTAKPTLSVTGNTSVWTNQDVIFTLTGFDTASGISGYKYSTNGTTWNSVTGNFYTVSANGTYYFKALDVAGNESDVVSVVVGNIDKVDPTNTGIVVSTTKATNENVIVTATYSDDLSGVSKIQYSLDGTNWSDYGSGVTFMQNGSVWFRAVDNAGNISDATAETKITNIDKEAPVLAIAGDVTTWVKDKVELTVTASDNVALSKTEYSFDGVKWTTLTLTGGSAKIDVTDNGTVYVRTTDTAGNVSAQTVNINNIDKIIPVLTVTGDLTTWQASDVVLTLAGVDGESGIDTAKYQVSYNNGAWTEVTDLNYKATANGTYKFRVYDKVGNVSAEHTVLVNNIDKVKPTLQGITLVPSAGPTNQNVTIHATFTDNADGSGIEKTQFSYDKVNWVAYNDSIELTKNGTVYFRAIDKVGNVSEVTSGTKVDFIDKLAPTMTIVPSSQEWSKSVTLTVTATDIVDTTGAYSTSGVKTVEYRVDGEGDWKQLTLVGGKGTTELISVNSTVFFRATDNAGNTTEQKVFVNNIDTIAPVITATASTTDWTKSLTLFVSATDNTVVSTLTYTFNGGSAITLKPTEENLITLNKTAQNGTYVFTATDKAGNVTTKTIIISNLDADAPVAGTITPSTTKITNGNVMVYAEYTDVPSGVAKIEYKIDNGTWITYVAGVEVEENATVYFRATDMAGNVTTAENKYSVTNIDKEAPTLSVTGDLKTWAQSIPLSIVATDNVKVAKAEYSFDGIDWTALTLDASGKATLTATENGTYFFRTFDTAGNVTTRTVRVEKVDTKIPVLTVTGNVETWTNNDVTLTLTGFDGESGVKKYQVFKGGDWVDITTENKYVISENGTYKFRVYDNADNISKEVEVLVDKIDKVLPVVKIDAVPATGFTNKEVKLSIIVTENDSGVKLSEYSFDQQHWYTYVDGVTMTENGTVYFKSTDNAANVSQIASYEVKNIDKEVPTITNVTIEPEGWTKESVTVSADFADTGVSGFKEASYSLDGGKTWTSLGTIAKRYAVTGIVKNGVVTLKAEDNAGNVTTTDVVVGNIDKEPPTITVTGNPEQWTTGPITLVAEFTDDVSGIATQKYSFDGGSTWLDYTAPIIVTLNGTYKFKATDNAGNESEVLTVDVTKIDPYEPVIIVIPSETDWTNQDVTVAVEFYKTPGYSQIDVKKYSYDNYTWYDYTEPLVFTENDVVFFFTHDEAGHTAYESYAITNIDKVKPVSAGYKMIPSDWTNTTVSVTTTYTDNLSGIGMIQYSFDGGENWFAYNDSVTVVDNNTTVSFRAYDKAGNVSDVTTCETVTWIDRLPPVIAIDSEFIINDAWYNVWATVYDREATLFDGKSGLAYVQYSVDGYNWSDYAYDKTTGIGEKIVVAVNETVYFRAIDNAGNITTEYRYISGGSRIVREIKVVCGQRYKEEQNLDEVQKVTLEKYSTLDGKNITMAYKDSSIKINRYANLIIDNLYTKFYDQDDNNRSSSINMSEYSNLRIGNVEEGIGVLTCIRSVTTSNNVNFFVGGAMTGTDKKGNTYNFGRDNVIHLGSMDLSFYKNSVTIGRDGETTVVGDVRNVTNLTVRCGTVQNNEMGIGIRHRAFMTIGGDYVMSRQYDNKITVENYTDMTIAGNIRNFEGYSKHITISVGKNSTFTVGDIENLNSLSAKGGETYKQRSDDSVKIQGYTMLDIQNLKGYDKDNTITLYNFTDMKVVSIDLAGGKNKIELKGRMVTLNVANDILSVRTITIGSGSTNKNVYGVKELQSSSITVGGNINMSTYASTITIGKYDKLNVTGSVNFQSADDKMEIKDYAAALIGNLDFGAGNNKLTIGKEAELAISGNIGEMFNMTIGKNSTILANDDTIDDLRSHATKIGTGVNFFALGDETQAKAFQGTAFESADDAVESTSVLDNEANGWLSATGAGSIARYDDLTDFFTMKDVQASSLSSVKIEGANVKVTVWTKATAEDDFVEVSGGAIKSGDIWTLKDITETVVDYRIEVALDDSLKANGGVATYKVKSTIA